MNSLMDDNKLLTLANGERISMPSQMTLLFETEDLSTASPATVSRAGIVYCDYEKLGWQPYFESWLTQKASQVILYFYQNWIKLKYFLGYSGSSRSTSSICNEVSRTYYEIQACKL